MEQKKHGNNARSLFKIDNIPCKQQVRNVLDQVKPEEISADFFWLIAELEQAGHLESYSSLSLAFFNEKRARNGKNCA